MDRIEHIKECLALVTGLDVDDIKPELVLAELGSDFDSLDAMELVWMLEGRLGVSLGDVKLSEFRTVQDVFDRVKAAQLAAKQEV